MKIEKIEVNIKVEVLSVDSVRALLLKIAEQYDSEFRDGNLRADDGDEITWETIRSKK